MKSTPLAWTPTTGWNFATGETEHADLVLYFGATSALTTSPAPMAALVARFPGALVVGCSTAGEILGATVRDDSVAALAVSFSNTRVRAESIVVESATESFSAAVELGRRVAAPDLRHVLVLSDGLVVNGTALSEGFCSALPENI